jgi:hypothetical protein
MLLVEIPLLKLTNSAANEMLIFAASIINIYDLPLLLPCAKRPMMEKKLALAISRMQRSLAQLYVSRSVSRTLWSQETQTQLLCQWYY